MELLHATLSANDYIPSLDCAKILPTNRLPVANSGDQLRTLPLTFLNHFAPTLAFGLGGSLQLFIFVLDKPERSFHGDRF